MLLEISNPNLDSYLKKQFHHAKDHLRHLQNLKNELNLRLRTIKDANLSKRKSPNHHNCEVENIPIIS